ncbi:hypothetical protein [Rubinisphaera italica]|uniref:Uncharacterized protein n=1 Tax=Rubinisphaera italica TaxID=2527969 RepID=A0A5C5XCT4_9PLAN|nr:hypothetical protein [Rubinisphaera italica]TWT59995.1 hypothetical protein Pan54_07070 [Rubinisphaera italica]
MTENSASNTTCQKVAKLKIVMAGVTTICVAIAATVTAVVSGEVSLGITAWVATAIIGTAAMLSAEKNT